MHGSSYTNLLENRLVTPINIKIVMFDQYEHFFYRNHAIVHWRYKKNFLRGSKHVITFGIYNLLIKCNHSCLYLIIFIELMVYMFIIAVFFFLYNLFSALTFIINQFFYLELLPLLSEDIIIIGSIAVFYSLNLLY